MKTVESIELNYNGYKGIAKKGRDLWYGKIEGIRDLVTYESDSVIDIKEEFVIAVDDWIETRKQLGINNEIHR